MENTQYYMEIPLTRGLVAKVSPHRFNELNAFKWSAHPSRDTFYAFRKSARKKGSPRVSILMHRVILGLEAGDPRHGDHINRDGLDNRDGNLRAATCRQNQQNRGNSRSNRSGFKGVSWHEKAQKWVAHIRIDGRAKHLGLFLSPEEAHAAYRVAANEHFGEFARSA
jgi:hypothetical protein